jgi:hypothetical protein
MILSAQKSASYARYGFLNVQASIHSSREFARMVLTQGF